MMENGCCGDSCFFNNSNNRFVDWLLTLMIQCNFISLRVFTVYMDNHAVDSNQHYTINRVIL